MYGDFRNRLPAEIRKTVYAATKWCIFGPLSGPVTSEFVLQGVKERSRRLGGRVELLQFHWYDVRIRLLFLRLSARPNMYPCCFVVRIQRVSRHTHRTGQDHQDAPGIGNRNRAVQF